MKTKKRTVKEEPPSILTKLFGDTPIIRLFDFLTTYDDFDYSLSEIAQLSGIHYNTLRKLWPRLEASGIVKKTRKVGKATLYQLNKENLIAQKLNDFAWTAVKETVHTTLTRERKVTVTVKR